MNNIHWFYSELRNVVNSMSNNTIIVPYYDDNFTNNNFTINNITCDYYDFNSLSFHHFSNITKEFESHIHNVFHDRFAPDVHSWREFIDYICDYHISIENEGHSHIHQNIFEFVFGKCDFYNVYEFQYDSIHEVIERYFVPDENIKVKCDINGEFK